jgi:hypothetical protein
MASQHRRRVVLRSDRSADLVDVGIPVAQRIVGRPHLDAQTVP